MAAENPPAFQAEQVIGGRFRIVRRIAEGGMGEVYLAYDIKNERHIALKIPKNVAPLKLFEREIRNSRQLDDPHIPRLDDYDLDGPQPYIAIEFVEGLTLKTALTLERFSPGRALLIAHHVATALGSAHLGKIVAHRDLKPDNIMLRRYFKAGDAIHAMVLDFGLAIDQKELSQRLTVKGTVMGTPSYMAPEQFIDKREGQSRLGLWEAEFQALHGPAAPIDSRVDFYSLGIILYELACGKRPLRPWNNFIDAGMMHVKEVPAPLPPSVPAPLRALASWLLEKHPDRRPRTAEELIAAIEHCQALIGERAPDGRPPPPGLALRLALEGFDGLSLGAALEEQPDLRFSPERALQILQGVASCLSDDPPDPAERPLTPEDFYLAGYQGPGDAIDVRRRPPEQARELVELRARLARQAPGDEAAGYLAPELVLAGSAGPSIPADNRATYEQRHGPVVVDGRARLYSLGVILQELLCGERPFLSRDLALLIEHLASAPPALPPDVPQEVRALAAWLLEKSPQQRPRHLAELQQNIAHCLALLSGPARRAPAPSPAFRERTRPRRRLPAPAWAAGALLLAAAAITVLLGWPPSAPPAPSGPVVVKMPTPSPGFEESRGPAADPPSALPPDPAAPPAADLQPATPINVKRPQRTRRPPNTPGSSPTAAPPQEICSREMVPTASGLQARTICKPAPRP